MPPFIRHHPQESSPLQNTSILCYLFTHTRCFYSFSKLRIGDAPQSDDWVWHWVVTNNNNYPDTHLQLPLFCPALACHTLPLPVKATLALKRPGIDSFPQVWHHTLSVPGNTSVDPLLTFISLAAGSDTGLKTNIKGQSASLLRIKCWWNVKYEWLRVQYFNSFGVFVSSPLSKFSNLAFCVWISTFFMFPCKN